MLEAPSAFAELYRFGSHYPRLQLPMTDRLPARPRMIARALRRTCPACGGGPLFERWIFVVRTCPRCGLRMTRGEEGYALGAIWFNLIAAEAVGTMIWVGTLVATWPDPPWNLLHWLGPVVAIAMPFLFYPFARTLFLAFDLCFRPLEAGDRELTSAAA